MESAAPCVRAESPPTGARAASEVVVVKKESIRVRRENPGKSHW